MRRSTTLTVHGHPRRVRGAWRTTACVVTASAIAGSTLWGIADTTSRAATSVELFSNTLKAQTRSKNKKSKNIGVKFRAATDGVITAVQIYRSSKQKKAYTATIWSSGGSVLARVKFPAASRYGWYSVNLSQPVKIKKNTTYIVSYLASDGQFGLIRKAFAKPYQRNGLTVPKNGGVYNYSSTSRLPTKTYQSTNYMVDVAFTPSLTPAPPASPTPSRSPSPTPSRTTTTPPGVGANPLWVHRNVSNATVRTALSKRTFFGHQSIGAQVLKGVTEYAQDAGAGRPTYPDPESGSLPTSGGFLAQSYVGENGDPLAKLAEFDKILRSGVGNRIDVAVIKLCYADIRSGDDPAAVFQAYKQTLSALERDYPRVTFLYATEPVVMANNSDGPNNVPRAVFNNLMRTEYAKTGRLWDVAAIESSTTAGRVVTGTYQGKVVAALNPEFASADQRHITGPGPKAVAGPLLELIAKS